MKTFFFPSCETALGSLSGGGGEEGIHAVRVDGTLLRVLKDGTLRKVLGRTYLLGKKTRLEDEGGMTRRCDSESSRRYPYSCLYLQCLLLSHLTVCNQTLDKASHEEPLALSNQSSSSIYVDVQ